MSDIVHQMVNEMGVSPAVLQQMSQQQQYGQQGQPQGMPGMMPGMPGMMPGQAGGAPMHPAMMQQMQQQPGVNIQDMSPEQQMAYMAHFQQMQQQQMMPQQHIQQQQADIESSSDTASSDSTASSDNGHGGSAGASMANYGMAQEKGVVDWVIDSVKGPLIVAIIVFILSLPVVSSSINRFLPAVILTNTYYTVGVTSLLAGLSYFLISLVI